MVEKREIKVNALKGESDERIKEVKKVTAKDEIVQTLHSSVISGRKLWGLPAVQTNESRNRHWDSRKNGKQRGARLFKIFEIEGRNYFCHYWLLLKLLETDHLSTTTTTQVFTKLKENFAKCGMATRIATLSGSQLLSREIKNFIRGWWIGHASSSPGYHKSNGKVEKDNAESTAEWYWSIWSPTWINEHWKRFTGTTSWGCSSYGGNIDSVYGSDWRK